MYKKWHLFEAQNFISSDLVFTAETISQDHEHKCHPSPARLFHAPPSSFAPPSLTGISHLQETPRLLSGTIDWFEFSRILFNEIVKCFLTWGSQEYPCQTSASVIMKQIPDILTFIL